MSSVESSAQTLLGTLHLAADGDLFSPKNLALLFVVMAVSILSCRLLWLLVLNAPSIGSWLLRLFGVDKTAVHYTTLQVTFPSVTEKSAYATEQLHSLLRTVVKHPESWSAAAARKRHYSLEIVATKEEGIRYLIRIPTSQVEAIHRTVLSFLSNAKVQEVPDDMKEVDSRSGAAVEFQFKSDYLLPLNSSKTITEHDMITYLTGHMRKLHDDERVTYQIVATPVYKQTHRAVMRRIDGIRSRIAQQKTVATELKGRHARLVSLFSWTLLAPLYLVVMALKFMTYMIAAIITNTTPGVDETSTADGDSPYEREVRELVKTKIAQPLSEVSIRLLVVSSDTKAATARLSSLITSFEALTHPTQSLMPRRRSRRGTMKLIERIKHRTLTKHPFSWPTIVSSSELSDLYHFPDTNLTKTEGLVKSRSRELPAPLSMKRAAHELNLVVGRNQFGGDVRDIGLTKAQRQKHMYVIGKTGTGKTTLLVNAIRQDMESGRGVAVLDPHGDMFRELLSLVPKHRLKDVVVFDPSDRDFPVAFNILDPGIEFVSDDDKNEWITSAVISVFAKLADKQQWGPKMEHILRNTTLTALMTPNPTLFTMQRLLTDKTYQTKVAKTLDDPVLKQFWAKEFKLMGDMQLANAVAPLTHRLGHFITATMSRHILLQEKSTIRMADIMNDGKILLANLSKGDIGEDQSFFFGSLLTSAMWMAAYQRTKIPERDRRDFYVYIDEFQNFATPQFGDIMSEGRKFRISLTVSHQNIAQIEDANLVKVVTGNVGTLISLKVSPQDEGFILPYFQPEVEKGDIVNLPPYHFYMKVTGDESEDAFSGQTIKPNDEFAGDLSEDVIEESRKRYATTKAEAVARVSILIRGRANKRLTSKPDVVKVKSIYR